MDRSQLSTINNQLPQRLRRNDSIQSPINRHDFVSELSTINSLSGCGTVKAWGNGHGCNRPLKRSPVHGGFKTARSCRGGRKCPRRVDADALQQQTLRASRSPTSTATGRRHSGPPRDGGLPSPITAPASALSSPASRRNFLTTWEPGQAGAQDAAVLFAAVFHGCTGHEEVVRHLRQVQDLVVKRR